MPQSMNTWPETFAKVHLIGELWFIRKVSAKGGEAGRKKR